MHCGGRRPASAPTLRCVKLAEPAHVLQMAEHWRVCCPGERHVWHGEKQHINFASSVNMSLNVPMPCRHARPVVSRHHHDYILDTTTITDGNEDSNVGACVYYTPHGLPRPVFCACPAAKREEPRGRDGAAAVREGDRGAGADQEVEGGGEGGGRDHSGNESGDRGDAHSARRSRGNLGCGALDCLFRVDAWRGSA